MDKPQKTSSQSRDRFARGKVIYVSGWKTCTEKDMFKYIPKKAYEDKQVYLVGDINQNGVNELYWYDKNNDQSIDEIYELYIDLNEDGIVDVPMSYIAGVEAEC